MQILTINTGSSSLKAGLYDMDETERLDISAAVERIGLSGSRLQIADAHGTALAERGDDLPDHAAAVRALLAWLRDDRGGAPPDAVGHRVVHGGRAYSAPRRCARICASLHVLGIDLDPRRNAEHAPVISRAGARVTVRVMTTDEDLMIARHTWRLIAH